MSKQAREILVGLLIILGGMLSGPPAVYYFILYLNYWWKGTLG